MSELDRDAEVIAAVATPRFGNVMEYNDRQAERWPAAVEALREIREGWLRYNRGEASSVQALEWIRAITARVDGLEASDE